jgi:hypothetical protein
MARTADSVTADLREHEASSPSAIVKGMRWLVPLAGAAAAAALVVAIWPGAGVQPRAPESTIGPSSAPKEAAEPAPSAPADKVAESAKSAPLDSLSAGARARAKLDDERRALEEKDKKITELRRAEKPAEGALRESVERQQQFGADARRNAPSLQKSAQANESAQVQNLGQLQNQVKNQVQNQAQNQNQSQNLNQAPSQPQAQAPARPTPAPPAAGALPATPPPPPAPATVIAGQAGRSAAADQTKTESVAVTSRRDFRTALPTVIATPDASVIWRIVNGRDIQRSADSGTTWATQTTVPDSQLTAGACPTATACWVVGSGGTVLRTTDGRTWTRITFPDTRDLLLVTSSSADSAVVTGSDTRRFATSDGGRSWIPEK